MAEAGTPLQLEDLPDDLLAAIAHAAGYATISWALPIFVNLPFGTLAL